MKYNLDKAFENFTPYINGAENMRKYSVLIPLDFLLNYKPLEYVNTLGVTRCDDFPFDLIENANYKFRTAPYPTQFYIYNDYVIWGLTAKILNNFLTILKNKIII